MKRTKIHLSIALTISAVLNGCAVEEGTVENHAVDVTAATAARAMENLGRGVVAVRTGRSSAFVSWRLLGLDPSGIGFNVYRSTNGGAAVKLNRSVLTGGCNYTDTTADLTQANVYHVRPVIGGAEEAASGSFTLTADHATEPAIRVPLRDTGEIHHVWVGDLDGDGEYDYVVDRLGIRQKVEAYKRDGTFLWALDQGPNSDNTEKPQYETRPSTISEGNWDGVTVYDMDGDGKAEVLIKTAKGVVFGNRATLSVDNNDAQFISVIDGRTGAERARIQWPNDYAPDGPMGMNFGIGYLNGKTPSLLVKGKNRVGMKGFNLIVAAFSFNGSTLTQQWKWKRADQPAPDAHQIRIVDVDGDGKDEFCDIGYVLNGDGTLRYAMGGQGVVHGDRTAIGEFDPNNPGLETLGIQQDNPSGLLYYVADSATGTMIHQHFGAVEDTARGLMADVDPSSPGYEYWSFHGLHRIDTGANISTTTPYPNFRIWWDGDTLSENLNDGKIEKWDPSTKSVARVLTAWRDTPGATGSYRDAPMFYGDIMGDWREEVVMTSADYKQLIVLTTPIASDTRLYTLPHNPEYRNSMTVKGYMQSHYVDYFLGNGMGAPPVPKIFYGLQADPTQDGLQDGAIYEIEPQNAVGKRLDVAGLSRANGANVQIWTDLDQNNQRWKAIAVDGAWEFQPQHATGKRLDVFNGNAADGTNVQQHNSNSSTAQRWRLFGNSDGSFGLEPQSAPGKRLDVTASSNVDGSNVLIWAATGNINQKWKFYKQ